MINLIDLVLQTKNNPALNEQIPLYANVINKQSSGYTALMQACIYSKTKSSNITVKILIQYGAKLDIQNTYGWTALMCASYYANSTSDMETVQILLNYGADIYMKNNDEKSAVHWFATKLILEYYTKESLKKLISSHQHINQALEELCKRHKQDLIKIKMYERVLKHIPEQNAVIRFKIGNMGYKIAMNGIAEEYNISYKNEIMVYLDAHDDNLQQKINEYLQN